MEISPNVLRKETVQLLRRVNMEMEKYEQEAEQIGLGTSPFQVPDRHGVCVYASLVASKAQCINTLVLLRVDEAARKR